jgi:Holliday junction DNA helicase RuvA
LYGFLTWEEKDLFLKLISVTGIGPKSALPIMAASSVSDIKLAISSGNVSYMQKFPGIGPKAAQQIILDLRGKVDFEQTSLINDNINDCVEALVALGYNKKEVNKVIGKVDSSLAQNEIIKQALKLLSKL